MLMLHETALKLISTQGALIRKKHALQPTTTTTTAGNNWSPHETTLTDTKICTATNNNN
jgi:hypothetical protein